jgi:hypothetical protein
VFDLLCKKNKQWHSGKVLRECWRELSTATHTATITAYISTPSTSFVITTKAKGIKVKIENMLIGSRTKIRTPHVQTIVKRIYRQYFRNGFECSI